MPSNSHDIIEVTKKTYGHYHLYQFYNYSEQSYNQDILAYSLTEQSSDLNLHCKCVVVTSKSDTLIFLGGGGGRRQG